MRAGSLLRSNVGLPAFYLAIAAALWLPGVSGAQPAEQKRYPWDHQPGECFQPSTQADDLTRLSCAAPGWTDFAQAKTNFDRLLADPDYDLIERAANDLGFSAERFASGEYLFEALYLSMVGNFQITGVQGARQAAEWTAAKGGEGYSRLAEALVYYGQAWNVRGSRAARTVSPEAWDLFYSLLEKSDATLNVSSEKLRRTGPWHALKLSIAFHHPRYKADRLTLLKSAIAEWPDYLAVYTIPMEILHPRRGGSFELMEGVAQFALENTRTKHGAAIYALAYEWIFRMDHRHSIAESNVDWPTMRLGFRDVETKRMVRPWMWKNFAGLACQVGDRTEARRLYALYDKSEDAASRTDSDPCRTYANAPSDAKDAIGASGARGPRRP
ncbi:MAG: hypothetical protein ABI423_09670 [Burkholderiales bacterium]